MLLSYCYITTCLWVQPGDITRSRPRRGPYSAMPPTGANPEPVGTRTEVKSAASISDAAVSTATGKGWKEWFSILDKAGARKMEHKAIARLLRDKQGVGDWWRQMVTVEYERVRGPRENYQSPEGFRVSSGKTIAVPIENLFDA